jgi:hypothetical protein
MRELPPAQPKAAIPYGKRPPLGSVPKLQVMAAVCLLGTGLLPWIELGLGIPGSSNVGLYHTLLGTVIGRTADQLGTTWMYGVAIGMISALAGAIVEAGRRPTGTYPRWLSAGGFGLAAGSAAIGAILVVGRFQFGASDYPISGLTTTAAPGLWAGLLLAWVGSVLSIVHLTAPVNPEHTPDPFAPSPWGPLPGELPPGFHPALGREWLDYVERGQVPPGYVPPSYGPAIYPAPGHVTPAYTAPVRPAASEWASPTSGQSGAAASETPTPGRLTVTEDGRTLSYTVRPGDRLLVGRDPDAQIRVSDVRVGPRHATIARCLEGWSVQDVDATRPTRLIDAWGANRPVRGEIAIPAGQLIMGGVLVTLHPSEE